MLIKSLFTVLSLTLALGLSAITTSTIAAPPVKSSSATTVLDDYKKPPSFLFVLQAKEATLQPIKGELYRYTLSMKLNDDNVSKIIAFSDRPYRIVEIMTAEQLKDLWGESTNSFKSDPPNAVLLANEVDASIVIIESYTLENNLITLNIVSSYSYDGLIETDSGQGGPEQKIKRLIVTIDPGDGTEHSHSQGSTKK